MNEAASRITELLDGRKPKTALVLGSGLGGLVDEVHDAVRVSYANLPGFPKSGVTGHAGQLVCGNLSGVPVLMLAGRAHYYEHGNPAAMRPVLEALAGAGIEKLILTNAAGSLEPGMGPGSVMLITDHINFAGANPLIGEPTDARFVGLTGAYDASLREALLGAAEREGIRLATGVYMWFSGPSFETPAEIRAARILGADAVGMSTVPEVILGRYYRLRVAAVSTITNFAAGMTGAELSHDETKALAPVGAAKLERVLRRFLHDRGLR